LTCGNTLARSASASILGPVPTFCPHLSVLVLLAKAIGVPTRRINAIVHGTRCITPETWIRLSRALGLSDAYWVTMQMNYDLEVEKEKHRDVLDAIERLSA
jgi:addiction module HigA family antidote